MTVQELVHALLYHHAQTKVGVEDRDGVVCEVQYVGLVSDEKGSYFLIRAAGGVPLRPDR